MTTSTVVLTLAADYCGTLIAYRTAAAPLNAVYATAATPTTDSDGNDLIAVTTTIGTTTYIATEQVLNIRPAKFDAVGRPV